MTPEEDYVHAVALVEDRPPSGVEKVSKLVFIVCLTFVVGFLAGYFYFRWEISPLIDPLLERNEQLERDCAARQ